MPSFGSRPEQSLQSAKIKVVSLSAHQWWFVRGIDGITFISGYGYTQAGREGTVSFGTDLYVINTPNTGDPIADADYIVLASDPTRGFAVEEGQTARVIINTDLIIDDVEITGVSFSDVLDPDVGFIRPVNPDVLPTRVPEPGTLALLGPGVLGLAGLVLRRRQQA